MSRWGGAVLLTTLVFGLGVARVDAATLKIKGSADGRGVIVNDGGGSVGTSNGSSEGEATLWTLLGFADPTELIVYGSFASGVDLYSEGVLLELQLVATVPGCSGCAPLGDEFPTLEFDSRDNEVFAWISSNLLYLGPSGPTSLPLTMQADQLYAFALSSTDAAALAAILQTYGAGNVYIGMAGLFDWPDTGLFPPDATFATGVPEPTSLTLFGSGLLALAARFRSRRAVPRR